MTVIAVWRINTGKRVYLPGEAVPGLPAEVEAELVAAGHARRAEVATAAKEPEPKPTANPRPTHKELDAEAGQLGIEFAKGATVADKVSAIENHLKGTDGTERAATDAGARLGTLEAISPEDLLAEAEALDIDGAADMDRDQLITAIMEVEAAVQPTDDAELPPGVDSNLTGD